MNSMLEIGKIINNISNNSVTEKQMDDLINANKRLSEIEGKNMLLYGKALLEEKNRYGLKYVKYAAHHGCFDAAVQMGKYYESGTWVPVDLNIAEAYYRDAAISGHKEAKYRLAEVERKLTKVEATEKTTYIVSGDDVLKQQMANIDLNDIPSAITACILPLDELNQKIKEVEERAIDVKAAAISAKSKSARFGKKKEAIESLQEGMMTMADAQVLDAEAQRLLFDYQGKLAETMQYLFALGVSNIAANRTVCQRLELKLKGASGEQVSDLVKTEILKVIKQLKAQEDIMIRQDKQMSILKEHDDNIDEIENDVDALEENIDDIEEDIDDIEENIDDIEEDIEYIEKNIDEVEENIDRNKDAIDKLNKKVLTATMISIAATGMSFVSMLITLLSIFDII